MQANGSAGEPGHGVEHVAASEGSVDSPSSDQPLLPPSSDQPSRPHRPARRLQVSLAARSSLAFVCMSVHGKASGIQKTLVVRLRSTYLHDHSKRLNLAHGMPLSEALAGSCNPLEASSPQRFPGRILQADFFSFHHVSACSSSLRCSQACLRTRSTKMTMRGISGLGLLGCC